MSCENLRSRKFLKRRINCPNQEMSVLVFIPLSLSAFDLRARNLKRDICLDPGLSMICRIPVRHRSSKAGGPEGTVGQ